MAYLDSNFDEMMLFWWEIHDIIFYRITRRAISNIRWPHIISVSGEPQPRALRV